MQFYYMTALPRKTVVGHFSFFALSNFFNPGIIDTEGKNNNIHSHHSAQLNRIKYLIFVTDATEPSTLDLKYAACCNISDYTVPQKPDVQPLSQYSRRAPAEVSKFNLLTLHYKCLSSYFTRKSLLLVH